VILRQKGQNTTDINRDKLFSGDQRDTHFLTRTKGMEKILLELKVGPADEKLRG